MGEVQRLAEVDGLLASGRWQDARRALNKVLAERDVPEAHDGLGRALWWLCQVRESLEHRERAHAGYLAEGRHADAAMVAMDIAVCQMSNLDNVTAARGWIARAGRSVAVAGDEELDGWLWLLDGYTCGELNRQRELLRRTLVLARRVGSFDLELAALADLGLVLVTQGEVSEGLRHLDEAMAGALGGDCRRLDTVVWASCSMLAACTLVGDHRRAAQWSAAADRFSEKYGCPFLQARCRSHYGRVLIALGAWEQAEAELNQALAMSADCGREPRLESLAGLAELRLRQGALAQAVALLSEVGDAPGAVVITAQVLVASGHPDRAVAVLQARLAALQQQDAELPVVASALVDAHLADVELDSAKNVLQTLGRTTTSQHPQADALTLRASGRVAAATGDSATAEQRLRAAVAEFERLSLPFEAARTRMEMARCVAETDKALAVVEAERALNRLDRLGAVSEAAQTAALLRELGVATKPGPRRSGALSQRELEILDRLRCGLTNPEIAAQLFLSPRTVAHHVSHILAKLNLKTRSEAAVYAATRSSTR